MAKRESPWGNLITCTIQLGEPRLNDLRALAKNTGVPVSELIRQAVEEMFERLESTSSIQEKQYVTVGR